MKPTIPKLLITLILLGCLFLLPDPVSADNCGSFTDCFNVLRAALAGTVGLAVLATVFSLALDFTPVVGEVKGIIEAITGRDLITGEKLEGWERVLGIVPFLGDAGKLARATDLADSIGDVTRVVDDIGDVSRVADNADTVADVADVSRLVDRYGDDAQRVLDDFGAEVGEDILRTYDNISDIPGADNLLKDLNAGGSTAQGALSEIGYVNSLVERGVEIDRVGDVIDGKKAGDVILTDGTVIDVKDYRWDSPYYRSQINIEKTTDSIVRQAQRHMQRYPGQPIEFAFTDLNNAPAQVLEALQDIGVNVTEVTWGG